MLTLLFSALLLTNFERIEQLENDIPELRETSFGKRGRALLEIASDFLLEERPLCSFPTAPGKDYIVFLDKRAVFKKGRERLVEAAVWELGCLFGVEKALTPTIPFTYQGTEGVLQAFSPSDLDEKICYRTGLYPHVTPDSYLMAAIAILLFGIYDLHPENCCFTYCPGGYLQITLFDLAMAFDQTAITIEGEETPYPALVIPFSWTGWDYPQAERAIPTRSQFWLKPLLSSLPERVQAAEEYLTHPLAAKNLNPDAIDEIKKRALALAGMSMDKTPIDWLNSLLPGYELLHRFRGSKGTQKFFFTLRWYPYLTYNSLSEEKQLELREFLLATFPIKMHSRS